MTFTIKSKVHGEKIVHYDAEDHDLIFSQNSWILHKRGHCFYAKSQQNIRPGLRKLIYMHRLVMGFPDKMDIDHKDCNGLNNQKGNLRIATRSNNLANQTIRNCNTSGFKGVHLNKKTGNYFALLTVNRKRKEKQGFKTPTEAARKYNELAVQYFGEFAKLNKIPND